MGLASAPARRPLVEWLLLAALAVIGAGWLLKRDRSIQHKATATAFRETIAKARKYRGQSDFLDDVLRRYNQNGRLSQRQYDAIAQIVSEIEQEEREA